MSRYSIERREWVLRQMMPPANRSVADLAEDTGISSVTLYAWRKQARAAGALVPGDGKNPQGWSTEAKFRAVLESALLDAAELAEYCRRKGLHVEQLQEWREACEQANATAYERGRCSQCSVVRYEICPQDYSPVLGRPETIGVMDG